MMAQDCLFNHKNMIQEIECHNCKKEFDAKQEVVGKCPYCNTKYDWYWDGEIWHFAESCVPIFETESEIIKKSFLISRKWI